MNTELVESTKARRSAAETRELVLDVAGQLFYTQGIRATGVDAVAAGAGIAPTTLYRLFASKDDLVDAYVRNSDAGYREWIADVTRGRTARRRVLALFEALADVTREDWFRGCPFLMTLAEYPDRTSAPHISAQATKAWVRQTLRGLAAEHLGSGSRRASALADQLALVLEGVYASTQELGADGPAAQAPAVVRTLLDAALPGQAPTAVN